MLFGITHLIRGLFNIETYEDVHIFIALCCMLWPLSIPIIIVIYIFMFISYIFEYIGIFLRNKFNGD